MTHQGVAFACHLGVGLLMFRAVTDTEWRCTNTAAPVYNLHACYAGDSYVMLTKYKEGIRDSKCKHRACKDSQLLAHNLSIEHHTMLAEIGDKSGISRKMHQRTKPT